MALREDFEALDLGYAAAEQDTRAAFITTCMVVVLVSIAALGVCIYRSMMQKRTRLEQLVQKEGIQKASLQIRAL